MKIFILNLKLIVGAKGFEPAYLITSSFQQNARGLISCGCQFHHLSICDPSGTRTQNPLVKSQLLYQLELRGHIHQLLVTRQDSNLYTGIKDSMCFPQLYPIELHAQLMHLLTSLLMSITNLVY